VESLLPFAHGLPQKWLPDETLFSLCSRYHFASGNQLASTTCKALFGHKTQGSAHDFPARLGHFLGVVGTALGSADDIVEARTVLPFYLRFASPGLAGGVTKAAVQNSSGSLKFQLGLLTSRFRANHPLKACHACMNEDRRDHATAYWHKAHQLPGVWVCLRHRCWLVASDLKATGVSRFHWILPSHSQFPSVDDSVPPRTTFSLAEMVTELVSRAKLALSPEVLPATYRRALRDRGLLGTTGRRLRHKEAGKRYASFLEPLGILEQLGSLPSSSASASAEIARLIGPARSGIHPIRHLSLATWLFDSTDEFLEQYATAKRESSAVEAEDLSAKPAPIADEREELEGQLLALLTAGFSVSRAAREIGIDTTTGIVWAASQGVATQRRPKILKRSVRDALIRLLRRGASKARAATVGCVSVQTITTLLRSEVGLHQAWKDAQFANVRRQSRRRWLRSTAANPHSGVKAARMAEPAAYAWLYRNDRDWLTEQADAMDKAIRSPQARVDWDLRDRHLSDLVRRVALELHEAAPERRLRLFQVYQRLPELKAKLFKLDRLPLTRTALFEVLGR